MQTLVQQEKEDIFDKDQIQYEIYAILLELIDHEHRLSTISITDLREKIQGHASQHNNSEFQRQYGNKRNFRRICMDLSFQRIIQTYDHDKQEIKINGSILHRMIQLYQ